MSGGPWPWSIAGEGRANVLPVVDAPERIAVIPIAIHRVRGFRLVHLAASWPPLDPPKKTLCGLALTRRQGRPLTIDPPLAERSRSGITTCTSCYNSPTLRRWLASST